MQMLLMHLEKVTVWCGLWDGAIIGLDAVNLNVTVNGEHHRELMSNFFLQKNARV